LNLGLSLNTENKKFYKILFFLCIPIIIQNLISASVNVIDTVMVSSLGETSVASIGIANQIFFLFNMSLSGVTGGASVFISQFYGKEDTNNIKKVVGLSCGFALVLSLLFLIPVSLKPELIIHIFSYDQEVVRICKDYFSIVIFSYPLIAISTVFSTGSRSIRNPKLGMICSLFALIANIILNYGLIFGNLIPAIITKIENFFAYTRAFLILSAPSSFPSIIPPPEAIHTQVIKKKLPVVVAI